MNMKKELYLLVVLTVLAFVSVVYSQMLHTKPVHTVTVNGKYYDTYAKAGTEITFKAVVTDANGDLTNHTIEVRRPDGKMSYDGWLTSPEWQPGIEGDGSQSVKTAKVTVTDVGSYNFVARATNAEDTNVYDSNVLRVIILADDPVTDDYVPDTIFFPDGTVNRAEFDKYWTNWTPKVVSKRLGPTFAELHPDAPEDRPTIPQPGTWTCPTSYVNKYTPYEFGAQGCAGDNDYWSTAGQVGYVPVEQDDPGMDRVQVLAYYDNVYALSPRWDFPSGQPHPDPQTRAAEYNGSAQFPVVSIRNYAQLQNEALTVYRSGLLGVNGLQTSREGGLFPGLKFPPHLIPTDLAITSGNELALVTLWDTETLVGKLAVVAIEAKHIPFHTTQFLGMPNQGSFSDLVLLGYVNLPMVAPSSVDAASNQRWQGPSDTAGLTLGQLDFTDPGLRLGLYNGSWNYVVADKGYAIVASKLENKVCIVDLTPVLLEFREAWLMNFDATLAARTAGTWPPMFDSDVVDVPAAKGAHSPNSVASPASRHTWSDMLQSIKVIWSSEKYHEEPVVKRSAKRSVKQLAKPQILETYEMDQPVAVIAGKWIDRWTADRFKAHVALANGSVVILDTSSLLARYDYQTNEPLQIMGSFPVCEGPTNIVPARFGTRNLPLLPKNGNNPDTVMSDPVNNHFYVVCRGSRQVAGVITQGGEGAVYKRYQDIRLEDPVNAAVADRGNVLTITDYNGRKILSFNLGSITDRHGRYYPAPEEGYSYVGELPLAGYPFLISVANVN